MNQPGVSCSTSKSDPIPVLVVGGGGRLNKPQNFLKTVKDDGKSSVKKEKFVHSSRGGSKGIADREKTSNDWSEKAKGIGVGEDKSNQGTTSSNDDDLKSNQVVWLTICFLGIMFSFVFYGLLLEYATSNGRKLHELSFLFVTSILYTVTAAAGRYVRAEEPTTIPRARFALLGITSMGSTFCSVRSLRYVIYPIQVLAKSCKPVPVMLMGAAMGKKYPLKKYINVCVIVAGVGLFMGGQSSGKSHSSASDEEELSNGGKIVGIILLAISLCFDGGTGAYEDKLMSVHSVGPFDLMYNIQLGKAILAGIALLVLNQVHVFLQMCQEMGLILVALGITGALGQVFIFVTIAKFGALTCSIIGLARKVTTLVASIWFYGHVLNATQTFGLALCIGAMIVNFAGKKGSGHGGHGGHGNNISENSASTINNGGESSTIQDDEDDEDDEMKEMLPVDTSHNSEVSTGDIELALTNQNGKQ